MHADTFYRELVSRILLSPFDRSDVDPWHVIAYMRCACVDLGEIKLGHLLVAMERALTVHDAEAPEARAAVLRAFAQMRVPQ